MAIRVKSAARDKFLSRLAEKAKSLPVGNPLDSNNFVGPLANEDAYKKYQKYMKVAAKDGRVLVGGSIKKVGELKHGY